MVLNLHIVTLINNYTDKDIEAKYKDLDHKEKIIKNPMTGIKPIKDILNQYKDMTSLLNSLIICIIHPKLPTLKNYRNLLSY